MRRLLMVLGAVSLCWLVAASSGDILAGKKNKPKKQKVCICHVPPGNPANAHTICIGAPAVRAHLRHGDSMGECTEEVVCGGSAGDTCDDDQFCQRDTGDCSESAMGICADIPETCPPLHEPVCGCDGITYSNSCFADVAGVPVDHPGACVAGAACGGTGGAMCAGGEFCKPPTGDCAEGAAGTCTTVPSTCSPVIVPVCGCDGVTYDNACFADAASVAVDHTGACQQACGGSTGVVCGTGAFCKRPLGQCSEEAEGVCQTTPLACPAVIDPVCGCNGTTYSNACVADGARVTVASDGPCPL